MKQRWLNLAEVIDAFRIVPRTLTLGAAGGYTAYFYDSVQWVRGIYEATGSIPPEVATYAGGTVSALGLILTLLINKYFDSGRRWNETD